MLGGRKRAACMLSANPWAMPVELSPFIPPALHRRGVWRGYKQFHIMLRMRLEGAAFAERLSKLIG